MSASSRDLVVVFCSWQSQVFPYRPHLKVFLIASSPKQLDADCDTLCLENQMLPIVTFLFLTNHMWIVNVHYSKKVKEKKDEKEEMEERKRTRSQGRLQRLGHYVRFCSCLYCEKTLH